MLLNSLDSFAPPGLSRRVHSRRQEEKIFPQADQTCPKEEAKVYRTLQHRLTIILSLCLALVLTSCGSSDDGTTTPPPQNQISMEEGINEYAPASGELQVAFADLNDLWDQIEAAFADKAIDPAAIGTLVDSYVAQTVVVAGKMDALIEFEDAIVAYGNNDKGMFTDTVGAVAKGLFNTVKKVVVSSGQMVRTGWRVVSGSHTLRQALSAPDSGIPIVSDAARRLQEHNAARDVAIVESIESSNSQDGFVPLGQLEGSTPAEKAQYYRNLPDDHPLKKETRGQVHFWHTGERTETVRTLKNFARDQVKNYSGAISGSDALVEIGDQTLSPQQTPEEKGLVRSVIKDADSAADLVEHKTVLIQKRDQPEDDPCVVIMDGVDPDMEVPMGSGVYDMVVIADDYVRSVQEGIEVAAGQVTTMLSEMYEIASHSLLLEGLAADPATVIAGDAVRVTATCASLVGSDLTLTWTVTGGTVSGRSESGAELTFTPDEPGTYTVALELTDTLGNTENATLDIEVTGAEVRILSWSVTSEQFTDGEINPGEQVAVQIVLANEGDQAVTGAVSLVGQDRITANTTTTTVTLPAGGQMSYDAVFTLPVDYSATSGTVTQEFALDDVTICQDMAFAVVFGVTIDPINSPVTDRVLNITGAVSNPSLSTADLVIDGDIGQHFVMNLTNGQFSQDVAVEASNGAETYNVLVSADSGSNHAEDSASFVAQVPLAALRVTLTWDTSGTDVDLWVTDPSGEACGWSHSSTASGLMLDFDDVDGYGPENITTSMASAGTYSVRVHYFSDHDSEAAIGTACTVVVRLNEGTPDETVTTYHGALGDTGDNWNVTAITIADGKALLVAGPAELTKIDPATMPAKK